MKLATSLLSATAMASHYRGGTYKLRQRPDGRLSIDNTQTWRLGADNYRGGCRTTHWSSSGPKAFCTGGGCTAAQTQFYLALFVGDDYCYGDGSNIIDKPSGPFNYGWSSCCWVSLTKDDGTRAYGGSSSMIQKIQVNDVHNNSPSFKLPPLWRIMSGCPQQQIDLAPVDADGDTVKCRWATQAEAGGAYNYAGYWPSLSLDEKNCIVKYDGTLDSSTVGVKPVGLMMEDFDSNGNVRSSIPVQFLAQVWTPNMSTRSIGAANYPDWFAEKEHEEHVTKYPGRGRRSLPSYCSAVPVFVAPTPADGHNIDGTSGSVSFILAASSQNGPIDSFSYQAPKSMKCSKINSNGQITCNWALSADQLKVTSHSFCYDATDNLGLTTVRQCLTISVSEIKNILEMANAVLDGSGAKGFTAADGNNYGCAGRGMYDPFATTIGAQVDAQDKAFYTWKKCVQCASERCPSCFNTIPLYSYDPRSDSCARSSSASRGVCECDRALVKFLYDEAADNSNYSANQCVGSGGSANTDCCNWDSHMWAHYNKDHQTCCKDGVKESGSC